MKIVALFVIEVFNRDLYICHLVFEFAGFTSIPGRKV